MTKILEEFPGSDTKTFLFYQLNLESKRGLENLISSAATES